VATVSNIALVSVGAIIGVGGLGSTSPMALSSPTPNYPEIVAGIVLINRDRAAGRRGARPRRALPDA